MLKLIELPGWVTRRMSIRNCSAVDPAVLALAFAGTDVPMNRPIDSEQLG